MKLPWNKDSYRALEAIDANRLPTDAERIRIAAALATAMRDAHMSGDTGPVAQITAESIRAVLTLEGDAWKRDVGQLKKAMMALGIDSYDAEDPFVRFEATYKCAPPWKETN